MLQITARLPVCRNTSIQGGKQLDNPTEWHVIVVHVNLENSVRVKALAPRAAFTNEMQAKLFDMLLDVLTIVVIH